MASAHELNLFLAGIEKKAFKQAVYAVRDDASALDIVQDAMISLTEKYGDRPASELPLIFTRILGVIGGRCHALYSHKLRQLSRKGVKL